MAPLSVEKLQSFRASRPNNDNQEKAYHDHLSATVQQLKELNPKDLAYSNEKLSADPLDLIDPYHDTLPYLFALHARISTSKSKSQEALKPGGPLYTKLVTFLTRLDPIQIRYAGEEWRELVEMLLQIARNSSQSQLVLLDTAAAMLRMDPSAGTFTSSHVLFVRTCLETGSYAQAWEIVSHDIHSFPSKTTAPTTDGLFPCSDHLLSTPFITFASGLTDKVSLQNVLDYYLLGAMNLIGNKKWAEAMYMLEYVLCLPTSTGSANVTMLEAYKKWLLASLLVKGKAPQIPNSANSGALKTLKAAAKPYESLVEDFLLADSRKLHAEVDIGQEIWVEDGNLGLVQQIVKHHSELSISKLQQTYVALPLSLIAEKQNMPLEEIRPYLGMLIKEGLLQATIEENDRDQSAVLRFAHNSSTPIRTEERLREELSMHAQRVKELANHVNEADGRLMMSKEYLDFARRSRKGHSERNGEEESMDIAGTRASSEDEDESMMTDAP